MAAKYSTSDVHPRDRLSYWREVATRGFARHEFSTTLGSEYKGTVQLGELAGLGVAAYECDPGVLTRDAGHISSGDCDDLLICAQVRGEGLAAQDGRQSGVGVGNITVLDPRRPFIASIQTFIHSIIIQVPRQRLEARVGPTAGLTAHPLDARKPLTALAGGFISMLPSCTETLDETAQSRIAEQALDLLALALSAEVEKSAVAISSPRACTLLRLKTEIEMRLADPELKPTTAAEAVGISVRYANALLSVENTSLERYILQRRLERCRGAFDDPVQAQRSIGDIAYGWGFSDLSHFGRRFKSAFGSAPSEYRRRQA